MRREAVSPVKNWDSEWILFLHKRIGKGKCHGMELPEGPQGLYHLLRGA